MSELKIPAGYKSLLSQRDTQRAIKLIKDTFQLKLAKELAPDICRCCGAGETPWDIVERAIKYDCRKVQFLKSHFNQEMIDKAHEHGIKCNVFWSDDEDETKKFLEMGIDTILTNDYNLISQVVKK